MLRPGRSDHCTALHCLGLPGCLSFQLLCWLRSLSALQCREPVGCARLCSHDFAAVPPSLSPALPAQVNYTFFEIFQRTAALHRCSEFGFCTRASLSLMCIASSFAALPSKISAFLLQRRTALLSLAMATSTALKAFLQAPREQRVTALRSLGAERMAQLEGELREARLTLFGPMPSSKAGKAAPPPVDTVPPPKPALHSHLPQRRNRPKIPPPQGGPRHVMVHRIANAKLRAAPAIQPRNALLPGPPMTLHRNAPANQATGTISRAKARTALGLMCQTATSGMISLLQTPPPAPHRVPHPTPHRIQHRAQHSSPTWMLVGLPILHIRRGSRRAKPRTPHMHRLGPSGMGLPTPAPSSRGASPRTAPPK